MTLTPLPRVLVAQVAIAIIVVMSAIVGIAADDAPDVDLATTIGALRTESYRFTVEQETTGPEISGSPLGDFGLSMEGAYDATNGFSELRIEFGNSVFKAECTYVGDGSDVFVRVHESRRADIGAKWVRTDAKNVLQALSLGRAFERLRDAEDLYDDLEAVGSSKVRGVDTTRYRGNVDVSALFEGTGVPTTRSADLPVEIFIDDDGLPRRTTVEFKASPEATYGYKVSQDYYDFGRSVTVERPKDVRDGNANVATSACFEKSLDTEFPFPDAAE
jgi:hypothetical protein